MTLDDILKEVADRHQEYELQLQNERKNTSPNLLRGTMGLTDIQSLNIGGGMTKETGFYRIDIFVPQGAGVTYQAVLDDIRNTFGVQKSHGDLISESIRIETPRSVLKYLNIQVMVRFTKYSRI
jgi:hypothetical protein